MAHRENRVNELSQEHRLTGTPTERGRGSSLTGFGGQTWCQDHCVAFRVGNKSQENPQYSSQTSHPEPLRRTRPPRSQAYPFRMGSPLQTPSSAAWLSGQLYLEVRVARSSVERDGGKESSGNGQVVARQLLEIKSQPAASQLPGAHCETP